MPLVSTIPTPGARSPDGGAAGASPLRRMVYSTGVFWCSPELAGTVNSGCPPAAICVYCCTVSPVISCRIEITDGLAERGSAHGRQRHIT
jgi:hypothetical protein